jgi:phosphatidylglycerophosphate synthase
MNSEIFLLQFILCTLGVGYILYVGYKLYIEKKQIQKPYQDFFKRNQRYLSPNMISWYREIGGIPCAIVVFFGLYYNEPISLTFITFIIAILAIGDFLDGMVAYSCNMMTEEGKKLDARADKWFDLPILYALTLFIALIYNQYNLLITVIGIMICDITGTLLRSNMSNPAATKIGKIKTLFKFSSMFIIYYGYIFDYIKSLEYLFITLLLITLALAIASTLTKVNWRKTKTA